MGLTNVDWGVQDERDDSSQKHMLEQRMQWQQKQSEEDAKWLHKEEENMLVSERILMDKTHTGVAWEGGQ